MAQPLTLGLVRIGTVDLALPAECIEEIVRGPVALSALPQAPRHILGAFSLRGAPVPTVDLATIIRPEADASTSRPVNFALVVRLPTGRFAIQIDEVAGIVRASDETITKLERAAGTDVALFTQVYTAPDGGKVAAILDLQAVLAIEGLGLAVRADHAKGATPDHEAEPARPHVLCRAGGICFAFDAALVRHVEGRAATLDSPLGRGLVQGFHRLRDRDLAVMDLLTLLEWPARAGNVGAGDRLVVVAHGKQQIALCVDEVVAIESFRPSQVQPVPPEGMARPEFFSGSTVRNEGEVALVLDVEAMLGSTHLVDRATLFGDDDETEVSVASANGVDVGASDRRHFLVYGAGGGVLATELTELEAVMPFPSDFVDLRGANNVLMGLCTRRGAAIKLVDMGALLGGRQIGVLEGAAVLVVRTEQGLQGYVVDRVDFLQTAAARPIPGASRRACGAVPAFSMMIRARNDGSDRSACVLGLANLAIQLAPQLQVA